MSPVKQELEILVWSVRETRQDAMYAVVIWYRGHTYHVTEHNTTYKGGQLIAELKGEASNRDALSSTVCMYVFTYICSLCNEILCLCSACTTTRPK